MFFSLLIMIRTREGVERDSDPLIDQIRANDNKRLIHGPLLQLDDDFMQLVCKAVCEVIGSSPCLFRQQTPP